MKHVIYILFLVFSLQVYPQKVVDKTIDASTIKILHIDGKGIFKIEVESQPRETISIHAKIEGETKEHLVLLANQVEDQLNISVELQPLYKDANDKLSVHKVISVSLTLKIPEYLVLNLKSDIAEAKIEGHYEALHVELEQGHCTISGHSKSATVNTFNGLINVTTSNTSIKASSLNGKVDRKHNVKGSSLWQLKSINGDIKISQSQ